MVVMRNDEPPRARGGRTLSEGAVRMSFQLASCREDLQRKEVIDVKYDKPQIIELAPAVEAIGSCESRKIGHVTEVQGCGDAGTTSAYEADE